MSTFPNFSNIAPWVREEFELRKDNIQYLSSLNSWVRITSAVFPKEEEIPVNIRRRDTTPELLRRRPAEPELGEGGLILYSNPDFKLFNAAGDDNSIYGDDKLAGTIGKNLKGKRVGVDEGRGYRPSPTIESIEIDEGAGELSRKASFTITTYTKEQMEAISKYFLEPGFTLFLEWGWNTEKALRDFKSKFDNESSINKNIASYQSFTKTQERRSSTDGHYDNYLGYITGGGVSIEGDKWNITVNLTGYTELPAYLTTNDKSAESIENPEEAEKFGAFEKVKARNDHGKKRFMTMYNDLPQNRRVPAIKKLINDPAVANKSNFINFDGDIKESVNSLTDGSWLGYIPFVDGEDTANIGEDEIDFPYGTEIIKDNRFIRFKTLMDIINRGISVKGYKIGDQTVSFYINSDKVPVSAFPHIYSTDPSTLFIPNGKTPVFSIDEYINITQGDNNVFRVNITETTDNSITDSETGDSITFPSFSNEPPVPKIESENGRIVFQEEGTRDGSEWGYLDNLYVNFDFAMDILGTKNLYLKDALYQILNGMSSAVNGYWDFQIVEKETEDSDGKKVSILSIVDLNFSTDLRDETFALNLIGSDSIFIDTNLDLEIGGAMMSSIIGERLSINSNSDTKRIPNIFGIGYRDAVLSEIEKERGDKSSDNKSSIFGPNDSSEETLSAEERKEQNVKAFLDSIELLPRVDIVSPDEIDGSNLYDNCYLASYDNDSLFSLLKRVNDTENDRNTSTPSPLMPIEFSFSVHGISGIKRGDKFKVVGLPKIYENGFFQVTSVKQIIEGTTWRTEVAGGFRQ